MINIQFENYYKNVKFFVTEKKIEIVLSLKIDWILITKAILLECFLILFMMGAPYAASKEISGISIFILVLFSCFVFHPFVIKKRVTIFPLSNTAAIKTFF